MASKALRKRKTSVPIDIDDDAAEQRKRDKKRVQNRLSQQCYREKQASYIKQLERFVENVQSAGSGSAGSPSQLEGMQKKQLRLMKENQELREAILRLRKKLLSLSTAASTSADDIIFERILNAPTDGSFSQDTATMPKAQSPYSMNFAAGTIPMPSEVPPVTTPDSMTDPLSLDGSNTMANHIPMSSSAPLSVLPPAAVSVDHHSKHLAGDNSLRFNMPLPNLSVPSSIPAPAPLNTPLGREIFRLDPADYSDLVMEETEKSVREAMAKMRFGFFRDDWSQRTIARQFTPKQIEEIDHMTLTDLCRIAFRILLRASALEKYVYAGGTVPVIEKILRWRIVPSPENRDAIDEPFRPTPLQQLVRDRHPTIDFIHWSELRDQLIIYMGAYNMQTLIIDTLQFLVRDVPELNISIPVMEFYNALAASSNSSDYTPSEGIISNYHPLISYNPNSQAALRLVRRFGLDRVLERKLMPAFAKKYPFLDISNNILASATPINPFKGLWSSEMPKLKQLLCSVERVDSNIPFREYGTSYGDGFVQTHIVVPAAPTRFTLHLTSTGYIAPGLAMFVFIDGVYQCNRNVDGLIPPSEGTDRSQTEIDFLVRQKEQMLDDDTWVGREWRFEKFNIVAGEPCTHQHPAPPDITHLGYIEVVVLRCLNSKDSMIAPPLSTISATSSKGDMPRILGTDTSSPTLGDLFFDGAVDRRLPRRVSFGCDGIEEQSTRSESKTVRFGEDEDRDQSHNGSNTHWDFSYTLPSTGAWHAMDGSYDRGYRKGRFHPEETWERRTQAYEHYQEDWRNPSGQVNEVGGRGALQDGGHHNYSRRRNPYNHSRARSLADNERRARDQQKGHDKGLPPGPIIIDIGSGTYHPSGSSPRNHQGDDHRYHYPESVVEAGEQYSNGHNMQDQYGRSRYGSIQGHRGGGDPGDHGIGWVGNNYQPFREPSQPPSPPGPIQEQRTSSGTWKPPFEWGGGNGIDDRRDAPQGSLGNDNDIGQSHYPYNNSGNTCDGGAGPDVGNWVINGGSGTWKPPARIDNNSGEAGGGALDSPVDSFNVTGIGQGTRTNPSARGQQRVKARNRNSDTYRSNQRGNIVHSSRENIGGWKKDNQPNQRSNRSEGRRSRGNEDFSKQGSKSNDCGNVVGGGASVDRRNDESNWRECKKNKDNDRPSEWVPSAPNERGYYDKNSARGGAKGDHRDHESTWKDGGNSRGSGHPAFRERSKPNECGYNDESWNPGRNDNRSNDGMLSRSGKGKATNRSNADQGIMDSGERGNRDRSNWGGSVWNGGSANSGHPNAEQSHSNNNRWGSGNNSNHGTSRRAGGNDDLSNRCWGGEYGNGKGNRSTSGGSKGRGGNTGQSSYGGSARGGGGANNSAKSAKPNNNDSGWRAGGDYTRSNQGDKVASHEVSNNRNGEDGVWGGDETGQGHRDFHAASANDRRGNSDTGKDWNGGNGNDNNGEDWDCGNNRSGDNGNGNPNPGDQIGRIDDSNNEGWNGGNYMNLNSNVANEDWRNPDNETGNGDNTGLDAFNYQTNDNSGNETYAADETNTWTQPTPNSNNSQQIDPTTEEPTPLADSSVQPSLPYAKPYWNSWKAESECAQSPTEPNTGRKRANGLRIGDEIPLYSIHKDQLRNHSASHQVRHEKPAYYARKLRKPVYLDSMEEPYAVFVFKYRSKKTLELLLKVPIADDEEDEKARLMRLSKDEIIEELLRMKLNASTVPNENTDGKKAPIDNNKGSSESGGGEW